MSRTTRTIPTLHPFFGPIVVTRYGSGRHRWVKVWVDHYGMAEHVHSDLSMGLARASARRCFALGRRKDIYSGSWLITCPAAEEENVIAAVTELMLGYSWEARKLIDRWTCPTCRATPGPTDLLAGCNHAIAAEALNERAQS